ncbi:1-piperideine-2-carboxylate/1-pyrroline-2-carboxylate reductase [NAD(P)H] [Zymomonas mobilis]|uniref:1-piperideine-2-carboxylate/1-pyrroline-2-carboxylate reductase [NAD(P)H] n=1 Tax=Zymomonas mobilis TaxID=542 RepID=A0A542VZ03_ZYMMB|nr:delta(1)-pyrroline-2-carboxylate reductase family protein [Zymomonas mobilis]TQL16555.1 1-piperideine-2-carboxylate/1-pyrroline-2-carboxylate reductase [NAD(P)H] [Zymomonas mobilis]
MKFYSIAETKKILTYPVLVEALKQTIQAYDRGDIHCPERVTTMAPDRSSLLMVMPATSREILVTKILTICPDNAASERPVIQGQISCADAENGKMLFVLDAPTVTMLRTSALSMLAIELLAKQPIEKILIIGTGVQAVAHCEALAALYPDISVSIRGRSMERSRAFCQRLSSLPLRLQPDERDGSDFDVVITVTSSREVIYNEPALAGRLVIAVGAFRPEMIEIAPEIVRNSVVYVDDLIGAPSEAGDIIQAGLEWSKVQPLALALESKPLKDQPILFKSVGCAAWDLAACQVVYEFAGKR